MAEGVMCQVSPPQGSLWYTGTRSLWSMLLSSHHLPLNLQWSFPFLILPLLVSCAPQRSSPVLDFSKAYGSPDTISRRTSFINPTLHRIDFKALPTSTGYILNSLASHTGACLSSFISYCSSMFYVSVFLISLGFLKQYKLFPTSGCLFELLLPVLEFHLCFHHLGNDC